MIDPQTKVRKLRRWKHADAGPLRDMDARCFPTDTSFWNDSRYHWWVASVEDARTFNSKTHAAYAGLKIDEHGVAHFTRCGVLPEFRGMGLQRRLLEARIRWCYRRGVKVIKTYTSHDNKASIANLKSCGFKSRRTRDGKWIKFTLRLGGEE